MQHLHNPVFCKKLLLKTIKATDFKVLRTGIDCCLDTTSLPQLIGSKVLIYKTKWLEKKLDGNYTRMLRAILNKSWRQHPTRHQLYGHLPPITKTIHVRRTRHAGHCWRSRDELISDVLLWTPHMVKQKQDDQHEHTFSNYVRIRDVVKKTCQRQ